MAEHSIFAPSGLSRVLACPASFRESQKIPRGGEPSVFAQRGTLLHEAFTEVWHPYVRRDELQMAQVFKSLSVSVEDAQYVLSCCDYVKSQLITCGPKATIELESHITLTSWGLPDVWGTADVIIKDPDNRRIIMDDHKFGQGVPVYAEDNVQLLCYLAGAVGFPVEWDEFEMCIIQPPLNIYSSAKVTPDQLKDFINKLALGIEAAKKPDARYAPDEDTCRFCAAKSSCRARYNMAIQEAKEVFSIASRLPDVTLEDKARLAELLLDLEQVKKSLFADMHSTILNGEVIPGWKLVAGRSIRKWADQGVAMKWLLDNRVFADSEDLFVKKFVSPSAVEKSNRKMKKNPDFDKLVIKPVGNPQLVREHDKRESYVVGAEADDVFDKIN